MEWVFGAVAVLLALSLVLVLALVIGGALTPKGHRASRSVRYDAAPETVWRTLTDWTSHSDWRSGVISLQRLADRGGHPVWKETRRRGGSLTSEIVEMDPERGRMVTRIVDESAFGGTWTFEVAPGPGGSGSVLTITEEGEIYNPIFRAIATWFLDPRATMDRLHRDLKARLGEAAPDFRNDGGPPPPAKARGGD